MKKMSRPVERVSRVEDRAERRKVQEFLAIPKRLTEHEAAEYLGNIAVTTLRAWRVRGGGPKFGTIGPKLVRYAVADLDAFIERGMKASTSTPSPAA